jgi:HAMP domain-containing protein
MKRRQYFVHPSIQVKYLAVSILPALVLSVFCTHLLTTSGELMMRREKEVAFSNMAFFFQQTLTDLSHGRFTKDDARRKILELEREFFSYQRALNEAYYKGLRNWDSIKRLTLAAVFSVLVFVGILSMIYSHRTAGPTIRLRRYIEMLAEGKEIPKVVLREHDEFKEIAEALEKLRLSLQGKDRPHEGS